MSSVACLETQVPVATFTLPIVPHPPSTNRSYQGEAFSPQQALFKRIQEGDAQAMTELYDAHARVVYSVALRVLRDPARAEDVLQEVFLKIWRKPERFSFGRGSLCGWLAVIARNCAIDVLRETRFYGDVEQSRETSNAAVEVETPVLIAEVREILLTMPAQQIEMLEMAFFKGMTHSEIVALTNLPLGTVKSRIRAALQTLRKGLADTRAAFK